MGFWKWDVGTATGTVALVLSLFTFWFMYWRRGQLKMTRSTFISFVNAGDGPKVFLRGMLHSTARRGYVVENMYVTLHRKESHETFSIWVHGSGQRAARGSGLFVGLEGVSIDHHFSLPPDATTFAFLHGEYLVEVFATLVTRKAPVLLAAVPLTLSEEMSSAVMSGEFAVFFDWGPDSHKYHAHLDDRPRQRMMAVRTIDTVVKIDLMATDHPTAIVLDNRVDYYFPIRVLNAGPFPIKIRDLLVRWQARGIGFTHHDSHPVVDEFRWLVPGEHQRHDVTIRGPAFASAAMPPTCRISFGGVLHAEADAWGGQLRYELDEERYTFGNMIDQRTNKPA